MDTRRLVSLGIEGSGGQVLPNGYLVYASGSAALMAVPSTPQIAALLERRWR